MAWFHFCFCLVVEEPVTATTTTAYLLLFLDSVLSFFTDFFCSVHTNTPYFLDSVLSGLPWLVYSPVVEMKAYKCN